MPARRGAPVRLALIGLLLVLGLPALAHAAAPIRAAYFYSYMGADHLDSLAAHGFDRAVIHWITDSLGAPGARQLSAFEARGNALGMSVVPEWAADAPARLQGLGSRRRYTWGAGTVERSVACPMDSLWWRSALLDRAEELLAASPALRLIAVDLELYHGSRHHYDAGACRCSACVREYLPVGWDPVLDPRRLSGLLSFQEARLGRIFEALLCEFAARHPGVELGVFDLDFPSFVHRALGRALARNRIATADYCERSYSTAGAGLPRARKGLEGLGLGSATLLGGLWLQRYSPADLPTAVQSVRENADGYFVFTSYSLWLDPAKLTGPYTLPGAPADYWRALRQVNERP